MEQVFFNGWQPLVRIAIVGVCSYAALIFLLRAAGKRTLSRMNAYDMVITMALGSILAKTLLTREQTVAESVTAMCVLIGLQYAVSEAMCRWRRLRRLISAKPALLFHQGHYIADAMKKERVDEDEVQAAIHANGIADLGMVEAVILGTNGDLSVLPKRDFSGARQSIMEAKKSGDL